MKKMIDRKALIHAIELRKEISKRNSQAFVDLPYEIVGNVIALLKEQEAVEPILKREGRNKYYNYYVCPRCGDEVLYDQNYCSECGVQFLWEGR